MTWIYVPPTHLSTREVEDSTLDSNWVFEALSQSCAWRETQQPPRSWSRTWRRVDWLRALCGLIPEPLTASRGVASWIGSLEASRASRGQSQEHRREPKTTDGSGHTSDASLATWNPEDSSWRTSQASFWEESSPYSESWPKTGTTRCGQLFALQTLEPHIAASASSFWPTATQDSVSQRSKRYAQGGMPLSAEVVNWPTATANRATRSNHHKGFRNLEETSEMWDTPDTMPEAPNNGSHRTRADHLKPPGLGNQAEWMTKDWPSPTAHDGRRPGAELTSTQGANLKREAIEWQSPDTGGGGRTTKGSQRQAESGLGNQSEMWLTPSANEDASGRPGANMQQMLSHQSRTMMGEPSLQDLQNENDGPTSSSDGQSSRRRLNPIFVAWLMGMPTDWLDLTSFGSSATE